MTSVDQIWYGCRLATLSPLRQGLGLVEDGMIAAVGGRIAYAGPAADAPSALDAKQRINCEGRWITPGLIDCHTHLLLWQATGGVRIRAWRLAGASYEEDRARIGGAHRLDAVKATRQGQYRAADRRHAAAARCADRGGCHHHRDQIRLRSRTRHRTASVAGGSATRQRTRSLGPNDFSRRAYGAAGNERQQRRLYRRCL